jgi:hypothetical protein
LGRSTSDSEEQKEKKDTPSKRENRMKNALKDDYIFEKAEEEGGRFLSHLSEIPKMNNLKSSDSDISEKEFKLVCREGAIILGCLLLSGKFPFSDYEKVLVPIYKEALSIAKRSLESNDTERIGMIL